MKAYICIGGPLDGLFASTTDFLQERVSMDWRNVAGIYQNGGNIPNKIYHPAGRFAVYQKDYYRYNSGGKTGVSMVWIHRSLLKKPVKAK